MGRQSVKAHIMFDLETVNPPNANEDQLVESWSLEGLTEEQKQRSKEERDYVFVFRGEGIRLRKMHRARKQDVYQLGEGEKIIVKCDETFKPCTKAGSLLASWLGLVAKDSNLAPLNIASWDNPAFRQHQIDMLKFVEEKFMYHSMMRGWVIEKLNSRWRKHKIDLKKIFTELSKTNSPTTIMSMVPQGVNNQQWQFLVSDWSTEKKKKQSEANKENALKNPHPHTLGRKPIAKLRKEMTEENNGEVPDTLTVFDASRKRKDGSYMNETTKEKMVEAFMLKQTELEKAPNAVPREAGDKALAEVLGPQRRGRMRGLGLGGSSLDLALLRRSSQSTTEDNAKIDKLQSKLNKVSEKYKKEKIKRKRLGERVKDIENQIFRRGNTEDDI